MSAMTSFTLRSLVKNRVRTIVTIAGVALAAALLTAVAASVTSLNEFLLNDEKASNGTWTARSWIEDNAAVDAARADDAIEDVLVTRDVGAYAFDDFSRQSFGRLLSVVSLEGDVGKLTGFKASEGRLPETADEIILPKAFEGEKMFGAETVNIGSSVEIPLGQRTAHLIPDADPAGDPYARPERTDVPDYQVYSGGIDQKTVQDGDVLNSCDAYRSKDEEGAVFEETLENTVRRTYTVVGFYEGRNLLTWTPNGYLAFTGTDDAAAGPARLYVLTSAFGSMADLENHLKGALGDTFLDYHTTLLRYAGVTDDRAVWSTLYRFAAILASVIMIACVSLIYNAFAISIAERTKQFGLLSSIGASRRQIRRAVVFEAVIIAAIGAPVGVAVGLGGTAAVLGALAPSIEKIAGAGNDVAFTLFVNPASIIVVAALTLVTVLLSVWIPARRAGSVSAIEAIKSTRDTRDAKPARADKREGREPWEAHGLGLHRAFGVPGQIARLNRKRGRGKGRAASVSLGLAVVLLITAGSATGYLSLGTRYVGTNDYDISTQFMSDEGLSESACDTIYERMAGVEGVEGVGWSMRADLLTRIPDTMAGAGVTSADADMRGMPISLEGDAWQTYLSFVFIDDDAFTDWARSIGVDPAPFFTGDVAGIGVRNTLGNDGTTYRHDETFATTGTMAALTHATYRGGDYEGVITDGQTVRAVFSTENSEGVEVDVDAVADQMRSVRIEALADDGPRQAPSASYQPTVVLPLSTLDELGLAGELKECVALYRADDHASAAERMNEIGMDAVREFTADSGSVYFDVYDLAESEETTRTLITIIEIFSVLFTGILMLIALANVFNTVTNGLILRKREFAVMKSIGMGERDFRKMIVCECIGFGVRGLVPGIVIAAGVSYLLYRSLGGTIEGLAFTLPWGHIAFAVAMVVVAMAASVIYGLHRCRTDSIVEALKAE